ncbi:MAG: anti-sigma factor antagonist [Caldithrix sp.]|nr:MAG: anti-sigma factor antagonist [Caldithrix sp.]
MEGIEISQGKVGTRRDIALLNVKGYVDTMTCSILLNQITDNLNSGILHVIVDMAQVNYVSSAGWGVFVGEIKGIREKSGDLKIVQMTPEVYDVFEMLEFNRILSYYDSIEEAINDFDISIGLDITKSVKRSYTPEVAELAAGTVEPNVDQKVTPLPDLAGPVAKQYSLNKSQVDARMLPLNERIRLVVVEDPNRGALQIKKVLNTSRFGFTKINILKLYNMLKTLNLDSKEKRHRFFRSR